MKTIITGGAGFIGSNASSRYLKCGHQVVVVDSLARDGVGENLEWLRSHGGALEFHPIDIRESQDIARVFREHRDAHQVLHLAAQVAVTTSVKNPREDFEINALGTFNVLEAMRQSSIGAPLIYASTNKVYGEMTSVGTVERNGRHDYQDLSTGVSEEHNLDFRQSCIYGYRQFGAEDQGWVAWFMIATQLGRPITIYGDGKQVRDILFIDDLLNAYDAAFAQPDKAAGRAFNIGGGVGNVVSLRQLLAFIEQRSGSKITAGSADWRPGDQKVFISDI